MDTVHWQDAKSKLQILVQKGGELVPDTSSISVGVMQPNESLAGFLDRACAYVCKEGNENVFGQRPKTE